jgi:hypothetical protein
MTRARFTRCLMISTFPLAVITPACGGSGSEPTPVSVAGGWVGTVQDNIVGAGRLEFRSLTTSSMVRERWAMTMANRYQLGGDLAGIVSGDTVTLRSTALDWTTSEAPYSASGAHGYSRSEL